MTNPGNKPAIIVITLIMLAAAAGLGLVLGTSQPYEDIPPPMTGAKIGGTLDLQTSTGKVFDQTAYADHHFLIFFGFANCPGICQIELDKMTTALNDLPAEIADQIQPLFITLDPERDTNEALNDFIAPFHPKIIALTGTQEEVNTASDQWRVYAEIMDPQTDADGNALYMINHSTYTYLMTPEMKPLDIFKLEDEPATLTTRIKARLQQG